MGRLHPSDFRIASMAPGEPLVVEPLVAFADDEWVIMPTVRLAGRSPFEIDVVVAHPAHGVGIIEVKAYLPEIVAGQWIEPYENSGGGPVAQLRRNQFALREHLRDNCPGAERVEVDAAVAFVNARGFAGDERPNDIDPDQIIWSTDLLVIDSALSRFMNRGRAGRPMFADGVFADIVRTIRPDVEFEADPGAYARWGAARIESQSGAQIRSLERLDANRRVFVTGGAGTGKSRLALAWARRSALRSDRTLLVCFNEPLGAELARRVGGLDHLRTGAFLRLALELDGMPPLEVPTDADSDFWNNEVQGHLHLHWPEVTERFDTIVVDEVQDFSPAWLAMLEALLDPDGPRRLLFVGDAEQELHRRGFRPPTTDDGWTVCELTSNTRNALEIARLLRNEFAGPPAPASLPPATHVRYHPANDLDELLTHVRAEVLAARTEGFDDAQIVVAALDHEARDHIRTVPEFVAYEEAGPGRIVCETARRIKGLEYPVVILVASRWPIDDVVLHVGVSRAVFGLTAIGPAELRERLGL